MSGWCQIVTESTAPHAGASESRLEICAISALPYTECVASAPFLHQAELTEGRMLTTDGVNAVFFDKGMIGLPGAFLDMFELRFIIRLWHKPYCLSHLPLLHEVERALNELAFVHTKTGCDACTEPNLFNPCQHEQLPAV